jgi:hypothetical protein
MAYSFVNWDDEDIGGQNYRDFMDLCFRYSRYFTFRYEPEIKNDRPNPFFVKELPALAPFMVESFPMRCWSWWTDTICVYRCTEEAKRFLQNHVYSLFDWQPYWDNHHNPQDPTFFRADGSVFSFSLIHEGYSLVYNREDEDVTLLDSMAGWYPTDDECNSSVPLHISDYLRKNIISPQNHH